MPSRDLLIRAWFVSLAVSAVVFSAFPEVDQAASRMFWDGVAFPFAKDPLLQMLREVVWFLSLATVLAAVVGLIIAIVTGRTVAYLSARCWAFLLTVNLLGPGLVVNAGLKSYWGRARPDQIEAFGGVKTFTPALIPSDQCMSNCSFTSGEAASSMALAIAVLLFAHRLRGRLSVWSILAASILALVGSGLRVAFGRHFLSDVLFSWLIVVGVALAIGPIFLRPRLPSPALKPDAGTPSEA
jgi:lipid A 4'-phosphatase